MIETVEILKSIEMPYGMVELRSDNVLTFRPDIGRFKQYSIQILEEIREVSIEITDGVPRPYLCDNRYITAIVNKDEQDYINKHFCEFATRAAMITESPVTKVIVNTYNKIFKPEVVIELFNSEDKAIRWLLNS